ncbi:tRNA(Ile)-lysidine synthase TilS/MesJ [Desulfobaculum xiamenense]|uniref:tRNA(Ile)-lysidine synthase TilS/MesJ n=1 Tax=Desulfobaculum xiamenense TaxID=995050 RepID=A0A846QFC7_9BACT|nr:tRNA 2-thiocytidine biosynthesis TtcA family protein [Desulfobaculum xiamenense]NJB67038.1 tRNA(Ile)-lysidine synthase TilS/MesJ [Desulfobaculum xiamenense]
MAQWGKLTYAQKQCLGGTGKLMQQAGMLSPSARVGIAVSGGVDSWVLLKILTMRQRIIPFPVELMALHLNPGFDATSHAPLAAWLRENGVSGHLEVTDYGPRAHSEENLKRSACFYCAMLRRKRLFELCKQYGLTHLAFGHTADDLAATFFMNIFKTGNVYGLSMAEDFFGGQLKVIRPLLYLEKKTIIKAAKDFGLPVWQNPCPSAGATERSRTQEWIEKTCGKDRTMKGNVLKALQRWQLDLTLKMQ